LSGTAAYWIDTENNFVLDDQILDLMARHAAVVCFNGTLKGEKPEFDNWAIFDRLRKRNPRLWLLTYSLPNFAENSSHIGSYTLRGFKELGSLLLRQADGKLVHPLYADVRKEEYQRWLTQRAIETVHEVGATGVVFDEAFRSGCRDVQRAFGNDASSCEAYGEGMGTLFAAVRRAVQPGIVLYNGIWSTSESCAPPGDQEKLLAVTDGVAIEYFGMDPLRKLSSAADILPYLTLMQSHPDKIFLVYGRAPWSYTDYEEDCRWQRYLYASYLLGRGPNTLFKYHASFHVPPHAGRTGGIDMFADWDLDLGKPLAAYEYSGSIYSRRFEKGLVLVALHDGEGGSYFLPKPMYDPEGIPHQGLLAVRPGQGWILLALKPATKRGSVIEFSGSAQHFADWQGAALTGSSLHLQPMPEGQEKEHDLLLDPIRSLQPPQKLALRIRTHDSAARLLFVAEVDDATKRDSYALVCLDSEVSAKPQPRLPSVRFRVGTWRKEMWPVLPCKSRVVADGEWHDYAVANPQPGPRYQIKRWSHVRLIGNMDMAWIRLE